MPSWLDALGRDAGNIWQYWTDPRAYEQRTGKPVWQPFSTGFRPPTERPPRSTLQLTSTAAGTARGAGIPIPKGVSVAQPTLYERTAAADRARGGDNLGQLRGELGLGEPAVRWDTIRDEDTGMMVLVGYDKDGNIVQYDPQGLGRQTGITEFQQAQLEAGRAQREQDATLQRQQLDYQRQIQESQLQWEQNRFGQEQEQLKQQRLAQLGANPISWLQFAAESGQPPVVQPWMLPLSPGQYGWQGGGQQGGQFIGDGQGQIARPGGPGGEELGAISPFGGGAAPQGVGGSALEVGQPIPGYSPTDFTGLPELLRPSRQLQSRMGPTALQQYYGYQRGQQGIPIEETIWRAQAAAPPGGRYPGLSRRR